MCLGSWVRYKTERDQIDTLREPLRCVTHTPEYGYGYGFRTRTSNIEIRPYPYPYPYRNFSSIKPVPVTVLPERKMTRTRSFFRTNFLESTRTRSLPVLEI